jgi:hypothetical protein
VLDDSPRAGPADLAPGLENPVDRFSAKMDVVDIVRFRHADLPRIEPAAHTHLGFRG